MPERTDPFDALRRPITAARPRPVFAAELERRLREELDMPTTDQFDTGNAAPDSTRHGELGLVHLRVQDADRAMRFFADLFGWVGGRFVDEHVSHYILNTAVTVRLLDDPNSAAVRPNYVVDDVASAITAIAEHGGRVIDSDAGADGGGWAYADDGVGLPIVVYRPSGDAHPTSGAPVSGDVGLVFMTGDATAATEFYGPVLGWELRPPHPGSTYFDTVEHVGLFDSNAQRGADDAPTIDLYFSVEALAAASSRIEGLGGHVEPLPAEPDMGPYFSVLCTDDQGTRFGLISSSRD